MYTFVVCGLFGYYIEYKNTMEKKVWFNAILNCFSF